MKLIFQHYKIRNLKKNHKNNSKKFNVIKMSCKLIPLRLSLLSDRYISYIISRNINLFSKNFVKDFSALTISKYQFDIIWALGHI